MSSKSLLMLLIGSKRSQTKNADLGEKHQIELIEEELTLVRPIVTETQEWLLKHYCLFSGDGGGMEVTVAVQESLNAFVMTQYEM